MSLISDILNHSYHARDKRAVDPESHREIPYGKDATATVRIGAWILKTSWFERAVLKWSAAIATALTAWLMAKGAGDHTGTIVAGVTATLTFLYEQLASYLTSKASMKIPPRVGAPTAEQERESIEAYKGMQPPIPFTSDSGTTTTRSAMFQAIIAKPTSPADDEAALLEFRQSLRPLAPVPVIPKGDFAVESWDRDNGEPTVTYYETKFQAIAFRDAQRQNHVRANLL